MKFRPHRELLDESMRDVVNLDGAKKSLEDHLRSCGFRNGDVSVRPYCYDDRIKWDTHLVTLDGMAIGYTDGPIV